MKTVYTSKISLKALRILQDAGLTVVIRDGAPKLSDADARSIATLEGMLS